MDNVTHTLISALVGEAIHRSTRASSALTESAHRNVAIAVMVVGGNIPDSDLLYTQWAGGKLDYLLHHRGHTHTVLGALVLSLLLFTAVRLWWRHRKVEPTAADIRVLALLAVLAPLLHLGLDYTNSYGVHPFWPADDRWYYGDAVFIVEPLLWACAAPLLGTLRSRVGRALVGLVLAVGIGLSWASGLVPVSFAALLTLLTLGLAVLGRRASPRTALAAGLVAWVLVTAVFVAAGRLADARVHAALARDSPAARTLDAVLTPMPANPLCREVLTVQLTGDRYRVRSGTHALLPGWLTAERCAGLRTSGSPTASLVPVPAASTGELVWHGELSIARDLPGRLGREYCAVDALLQFARVPWVVPHGAGWLAGDLRYDREPELGFAEIEVGPAADTCPVRRPPRVPPRLDLLTG